MGEGCHPVPAWCPWASALPQNTSCIAVLPPLGTLLHLSGQWQGGPWLLCWVPMDLSALPGPSPSPFDLERLRHISSAGPTIDRLALRGLFISYIYVVTPGDMGRPLPPHVPFSHTVSSALVWPALSPLSDLVSILYPLTFVSSGHSSSLALETFLSTLT